MIGATGSGTGKTTICLAMLSYLAGQGFNVAPFKVGPDFIDPGHHTRIAGKTSFNLDSWMLSKAYNKRMFTDQASGSDIAVVEGVMGLFDGYDGLSEAGSTAQMAKWLNLPVVLIVSARGKARSAAAIVQGFEKFDQNLTLAGVIFSQTGSLRHYEYLKTAVEQTCRTKCLGFMPRNETIVMPERHLGLVTADERGMEKETLLTLTAMVRDHIDMNGLIDSLDSFDLNRDSDSVDTAGLDKHRPTIAVARDKAFCFYYQDNIDQLKRSGARIVEFSPLSDDRLPRDIDGLYLGGGYPEVFADTLSQKTALLGEIRENSRSGMPIYGECGGFMFLCRTLAGMDNTRGYAMSGCFEFDIQMSKRLRSLGYREITLNQDTLIGKKGDVLRGHEFHYSSLINETSDRHPEINSDIYKVTSRAGQDLSLKGFQVANTLGSYLHIHFGSNPNAGKQFVETCKRFRNKKTKNVIQRA